MQTAGSSEVAGSRVGGLSSRSCEAIRPPLKLRRHAGRRMAAGVRAGRTCTRTRGTRTGCRKSAGFAVDYVTQPRRRGSRDAARGATSAASRGLPPPLPAQLRGTLTEGVARGSSRALAEGKVETPPRDLRDSAESLCPSSRIGTSARRRLAGVPRSLIRAIIVS